MCGRYSFSSSKEKINKHFGLSIKKDLKVSYNIAPTHQAYVITNETPKQLQRLAWGLVPHWAKTPKIGNNLLNARFETISTKPSFRIPVRKRRCLVLADGFYEWRRYGSNRIPYRITALNSSDLLVFAGVWDIWETRNGAPLKTFTIITTPPNEEMKSLHNRMPMILFTKAEQEQWLDNLSLADVLALLKTPADGKLKIFPVSTKVNKPTYNEADLYNPVETPPSLFDFT